MIIIKNSINYLYGISCDSIIKRKNNYIISNNNQLYLLCLVDSKFINKINIYNFLIKNNYYVYKILYNKEKNIITNINNNNYLLIKIDNNKYEIDLSDIINSSLYYGRGRCNWYNLWCKKNDYYEYQIEQIKKSYPLLYNSFSYYKGLTENAISLINYINNEIEYYVSHQRIYKNETNIQFYNPTNIILDSKVRDICEYFKSSFFGGFIQLISVKNYIDYNINSFDEAILFMARMLYPSYYFDLYDEIINKETKESKLLNIRNKICEYEELLKEIYCYLHLKYNIPEIEWLKKI